MYISLSCASSFPSQVSSAADKIVPFSDTTTTAAAAAAQTRSSPSPTSFITAAVAFAGSIGNAVSAAVATCRKL